MWAWGRLEMPDASSPMLTSRRWCEPFSIPSQLPAYGFEQFVRGIVACGYARYVVSGRKVLSVARARSRC